MKKSYKKWVSLLLSCLMLTGCGTTQEREVGEQDKTIYEIPVPGIHENCIDAEAQNLYYTISGQSKVYQYTMEGAFVDAFLVDADEEEKETRGFIGERPDDAADLSGLCMYGNTLYCFRELKNTLMAIDIHTGEDHLVAKMEESLGIIKIAAGENSVLILQFGMENKEIWVADTEAGTVEKLPVRYPVMIAAAGEDTYWIEAYDGEAGYYFQEYKADTGELSEEYRSNFTYELSDMVYSQKNGQIYGRFSSIQYVSLNPREAESAARFVARGIYLDSANLQLAGDKLYVTDKETETIYYFNPAAFVVENKPLKGYVTSEFAISDWAGYNIELEVITWEELALKVLAEDKDYDFVVMSTDMAESASIRDVMAYAPIPEEYVEKYWKECRQCVREAATYNGDIWMLPLNLYAGGLVYSEENLAAYGISMEEMHTVEDVCKAANLLYEAGMEGRYEVKAAPGNLLQAYLQKADTDTISFDTEEFRAILDFVQGEYGTDAVFKNSYVQLNVWDFAYDETSSLSYVEQYQEAVYKQAETVYMEEVSGYSWDYEKYMGADGIRVCAMPGITAGEAQVMVTADILIINPNTANREEVFSFAEAMSETYLANPATYLSANPDIYSEDIVTQDVCRLYENGKVVFGLPDDLFEIYWRYMWGQETDKEKVIDELNRTVNMYYGE